eukprot:snap_masked-scaffold_4-processed-gene-16.45-mRNA-1 protein AED:1.00 eAED:1.00 QI:0/-1/0/0/-1/1/1/0/115
MNHKAATGRNCSHSHITYFPKKPQLNPSEIGFVITSKVPAMHILEYRLDISESSWEKKKHDHIAIETELSGIFKNKTSSFVQQPTKNLVPFENNPELGKQLDAEPQKYLKTNPRY